PASGSVQVGRNHTLSVAPSGGVFPWSYQWFIGNSGDTSNPIPGATSSSYTATPTSTTNYSDHVRDANNGSAGPAVDNSDTATLTVALGFSQQPAHANIDSGQSHTLSVTAAAGTAPYSYQWYTGASGDTSNPIPGATSSSYTTTPGGSTT